MSSSGYAVMQPERARLADPEHVDPRGADRARASSTATETTSSRASVAIANHQGTAPKIATVSTAVRTSARSATGSRILPSVLTWCRRRARNPSTQSVDPSVPEQEPGGELVRVVNSSQT